MDKVVETQILKALDQINSKLEMQGELLLLHGETMKEHTGILSALRNGQESLKAEISELRLQTTKDLGEIKEQIKGMEDSIDVLKEESWTNKKDIRRLQKTMGMS
jgi:chromosome segregation ATPase